MMIPDDTCQGWMLMFFLIGLLVGALACWGLHAQSALDELRNKVEPIESSSPHTKETE